MPLLLCLRLHKTTSSLREVRALVLCAKGCLMGIPQSFLPPPHRLPNLSLVQVTGRVSFQKEAGRFGDADFRCVVDKSKIVDLKITTPQAKEIAPANSGLVVSEQRALKIMLDAYPGSHKNVQTFGPFESTLTMAPTLAIIVAISIALPIAWFVSDARGRTPLRRRVLGLVTILWLFAVAILAHGIQSFEANSYFTYESKRLLDASVRHLRARHSDAVFREWGRANERFKATYENRGRYAEIVDDAVRGMENQ